MRLLALSFSTISASACSSGDAPPPATGPLDGGGEGSTTLPLFSFFVTSLKALQELSGSQTGFGGDLRFGESGPGAGLRGADKICTTIAERSMPGSGAKQWRAFLSATADERGAQVDAIDRVGNGPWYDRLGRRVATTTADLLQFRPANADPAIVDDLPNEDGVPNQQPDPTSPAVDNHDTLTGSNDAGRLYGPNATCLDWTTADGAIGGRPRVGHSWPRRLGGDGGFPFPFPSPDGGDGGFPFPFPFPFPFGDGGPGSFNYGHWISCLDEAGCGAGVNLVETGPPNPANPTVGSGGGYGGFYCFALTP